MERLDEEAVRRQARESRRLALAARERSVELRLETCKVREAAWRTQNELRRRWTEIGYVAWKPAEPTMAETSNLVRFVLMREATSRIEAEEGRLQSALDRLRQERTILLIESDALARQCCEDDGFA